MTRAEEYRLSQYQHLGALREDNPLTWKEISRQVLSEYRK